MITFANCMLVIFFVYAWFNKVQRKITVYKNAQASLVDTLSVTRLNITSWSSEK
jgi:hypothetical protein